MSRLYIDNRLENAVIRLIAIMTGPLILPVDTDGPNKRSTQSDLDGAQKYRTKYQDVPFDFAIAPEVQPYRDVASIISAMDPQKVESIYELYCDPASTRGNVLRSLQANIERQMQLAETATFGWSVDLKGGLAIASHGNEAWQAINEQIIQLHLPSVVLVVGPRLTVAAMAYAAVGGQRGQFASVIRQIDFLKHDAIDLMYAKTGKVAGVHLESVMSSSSV